MDVKDLFKNISDIKREIVLLEEQEDRLRQSMLPGAIRYDKDNVISSPQDPMSKYAERISDTEERIRKRLDILQKYESLAQTILDKMPTSKYRMLLSLKYIEEQSWKYIADYMGYGIQHIKQYMHNKALEEAQEIYEKMKINTF